MCAYTSVFALPLPHQQFSESLIQFAVCKVGNRRIKTLGKACLNNSLSLRIKKTVFSVQEPPHLRTFTAIHSCTEPKAPVEALQPLARGVGGVGKECVWAGRRSG